MSKFRPMGSLSAAVLLTLSLAGCKTDPAARQAEVVDRAASPATTTTAPYTGVSGEVAGVVTVTGKPPARVLIDRTMDPACGISSPAPVYSEQYAVANGKLANVFVYVKQGPPTAMQAGAPQAPPAVLDQKGCQYTPHVVAVMAGGTVEFRNSDLTMHNIHTMPATVGNQPIDISQGPKGAPVSKVFLQPELMMPVRCNNHPWMNAFVNVSATPFFAVSDNLGQFTLRGLPPGDYTLGLVHEKLGEQELKVSVAANTTAKAAAAFAIK